LKIEVVCIGLFRKKPKEENFGDRYLAYRQAWEMHPKIPDNFIITDKKLEEIKKLNRKLEKIAWEPLISVLERINDEQNCFKKIDRRLGNMESMLKELSCQKK